MVTVLDPMNTHSELADYVCKHKSVVHDMLRALGSIKLSLGGGWVHIGDDWEIVYNSCMHEPSTRYRRFRLVARLYNLNQPCAVHLHLFAMLPGLRQGFICFITQGSLMATHCLSCQPT